MPVSTLRTRKKQLGKFRMGARAMLMSIRASLEDRAAGIEDVEIVDVELMKIVDRIVVRECDELISLLRRISNDIAQTIIEDPMKAAEGWMLMSRPVLKDLQRTLHEFVPENLAKKYRGYGR